MDREKFHRIEYPTVVCTDKSEPLMTINDVFDKKTVISSIVDSLYQIVWDENLLDKVPLPNMRNDNDFRLCTQWCVHISKYW